MPRYLPEVPVLQLPKSLKTHQVVSLDNVLTATYLMRQRLAKAEGLGWYIINLLKPGEIPASVKETFLKRGNLALYQAEFGSDLLAAALKLLGDQKDVVILCISIMQVQIAAAQQEILSGIVPLSQQKRRATVYETDEKGSIRQTRHRIRVPRR
jgi:hypothetical protein